MIDEEIGTGNSSTITPTSTTVFTPPPNNHHHDNDIINNLNHHHHHNNNDIPSLHHLFMSSPVQEPYRFPPPSSSSSHLHSQQQLQQQQQQQLNETDPFMNIHSSSSSSPSSPPPQLMPLINHHHHHHSQQHHPQQHPTNNHLEPLQLYPPSSSQHQQQQQPFYYQPSSQPSQHRSSLPTTTLTTLRRMSPGDEHDMMSGGRQHRFQSSASSSASSSTASSSFNHHQRPLSYPSHQHQHQQNQPTRLFINNNNNNSSSPIITTAKPQHQQPPITTTNNTGARSSSSSAAIRVGHSPTTTTTHNTAAAHATHTPTHPQQHTPTQQQQQLPVINEQQLRKFCQINLQKLIPLSYQLEETITYWYQQNFKQHPVRVLLQKGPFYWTRLLYRRFMSWSRKYFFSSSLSATTGGGDDGGSHVSHQNSPSSGGGSGGTTNLAGQEPSTPIFSPTSWGFSSKIFSPTRESWNYPLQQSSRASASASSLLHLQQQQQHEDQKLQQIVTAKQDLNHTLFELQKWSKLNAELIGISSQILKELNSNISAAFSSSGNGNGGHHMDANTNARCVHLLNELVQYFARNRHLYQHSTLLMNAAFSGIGSGGGNSSTAMLLMSQYAKFIDEHVDQIKKHVLPLYKRPNHLNRNWIKYTIGLSVVSFMTYKVATNRDEILRWAHESYDSILRFYVLHLQEPVVNMYNVIRFDTHKQLIDPESVDVSIDSLERMVTSFARDHGSSTGSHMTEEELGIVSEQARRGNLAYIMHKYEQEMKNPLKNALFGDMAQLLLIQVQKQKVDIERTMIQMDKLMQSNELNFELMATVPALLLAVFVVYNVLTYQRRTDNRVFASFKSSLVHLERVLNRFPTSEQESMLMAINNNGSGAVDNSSQQLLESSTVVGIKSNDIDEASGTLNRNQASGFVHLHVRKMRRLLNDNVNKFQTHYRKEASVARDLHFDLTELDNHQISPEQRMRTVERMYRSYYFLNNDFIQNQQ